MSKAEKFIQDYTRGCSNECNIVVQRTQDLMPVMATETYYEPWLTPDHARAVAQIAREEVIEDIIDWLMLNLFDYISEQSIDHLRLNEDIRKALEKGE